MIKEIHIDFNKKTIEFEANQFRKGDMTYPSYKLFIHSVYPGQVPTIDDVLGYVKDSWPEYNKAIKQHYESFVKHGRS